MAAEIPMSVEQFDVGWVTTERVATAMQEAWNEFVTDTGNYPDCFRREGYRLYADFSKGNFAEWVAARIRNGGE